MFPSADTDHNMTKSVYFHDPDGNRIEFFCNSFETAAEGLAEMRRPGRKNAGTGVGLAAIFWPMRLSTLGQETPGYWCSARGKQKGTHTTEAPLVPK
jgi:hypothetical protein